MTIYILIWAAIGTAMLGINYTRYRSRPLTVWTPGCAWVRAFIYFAFCNIFAAANGTLDRIFADPLATAEQLRNPWWLAYGGFCFIYIFSAYWIMWARMTLTFDRRYNIPAGLLLGGLWGFSTGVLLLSFYHLWGFAGLPGWLHFLLAYLTMGIWQYFIQDYWWDVYISPEHDTLRSIVIKVLVCHIPGMAICLGFLVLWENYAIYVAAQVFALTAAIIMQKFPPPWARGYFHAPMYRRGLFGLPRGAGYRGELDGQGRAVLPATASGEWMPPA